MLEFSRRSVETAMLYTIATGSRLRNSLPITYSIYVVFWADISLHAEFYKNRMENTKTVGLKNYMIRLFSGELFYGTTLMCTLRLTQMDATKIHS